MSDGELTPDDVDRMRAIVRARLSQRNWTALIATICGATVPVGAALSARRFPGWTILFLLLSGAVAMLLWHVNPWRRPQVRCPVCGDDWEHDDSLTSSRCEQCGLELPARATNAALDRQEERLL